MGFVFLLSTLLIFIPVSGDSSDIVVSSTMYKSKSLYEAAEDAMLKLHNRYPDITSLENIGESLQGRDIKALKVGSGEKKIFINGAHHGKEWITSVLILEQIDYILKAYEKNESIGEQNVRKLLEAGSICFVPMVNPDGVEIARGTIPNPFKVSASQVKSNARGVDLNRNYPAKWEHANLVKSPGPKGYKGEKPLSEPETKAIEEYVKANAFETVLCYHSAGNLVYWYYDQAETLERDYKLAKELGVITGYKVESPEDAAEYHAAEGDIPGSMAGMKDWFIQDFKKPGFTLEIGSPTSSGCVEYSQYSKIWQSNKDVPVRLLEAFVSIETVEEAGAAVQAFSSNVSGMIVGKTLNQVEYSRTVKLHSMPEGKVIGTVGTAKPVKLLSLSYDGWYKVLTDKYEIAYIDSRYIQVNPNQSSPPTAKNILKGKKLDDTYITIISQNKQTIEIYEKSPKGYIRIIESPVSTGKVDTPTPNGWFTAKGRRGEYSFIPKYQLGTPYFVQLKGGYLLHGLPMSSRRQIPKSISDALGSKASHGCIRLPVDIAKFVYQNIKEDSLVVIDNDPPSIDEIIKKLGCN